MNNDVLILDWVRQLGTPGYDGALNLAIGPGGDIWLCGYSTGNIEPVPDGEETAGEIAEAVAGSEAGAEHIPEAALEDVLEAEMEDLEEAEMEDALEAELEEEMDEEDLEEAEEVDRESGKGDSDAWVARFDGFGNVRWMRQFGSELGDEANGIVVDDQGTAYLSGMSFADEDLGQPEDQTHAWIAAFSVEGEALWLHRLPLKADDRVHAIGLGPDQALYVAGMAFYNFETGESLGNMEAWVGRFDLTPEGPEAVWMFQFGTGEYDGANDLHVDEAGNLYLAGVTYGEMESGSNAGLGDAWLAKLNGEGEQLWVRQIGSPTYDYAQKIRTDGAGNVIVTGVTQGAIVDESHAGGGDFWLAKFSPDGDRKWLRQIGTEGYDSSNGLAVKATGEIYVAGFSSGELEEGAEMGGGDAWVGKFDQDGETVWIRQFGTDEFDDAEGIAIGKDGALFLAGVTRGEFEPGHYYGAFDAWLARFIEAPEEQAPEKLALRLLERASNLEEQIEGLETKSNDIMHALDHILTYNFGEPN